MYSPLLFNLIVCLKCAVSRDAHRDTLLSSLQPAGIFIPSPITHQGYCQFVFPQCFAVTADNCRYFANMRFIQQSGEAYVYMFVCVCICVSPFPSVGAEELALTSCQEVKPFNLI